MSKKLTYPRLYIAILLLSLCILACSVQVPNEKTSIASAVVAEPAYQVVTVTGNVNVRYEGIATGIVAEKGTRLVGYVDGNLFRLLSGETVWLGCTSVNSNYGCQ